MAETGQRVGDYEVIAQLGAGGMGRVYKVRNVISNREEAMKILLPDFAADPDLAARFMAEIRTLAGLDHPGIAQLRTAFQHNNQFVMVMEYVEGTTLERLASEVRIPLRHVLDYSMQVLAALSYAHAKGVTHRDIKPANIMITMHGLIKLMDFGIAKSSGEMQLTRPGSTMGSVYYMSPEQVQGDTVDGRSDLYSFGVTLYELLTGRKPFQADTTYSVLNQQLTQPPTPPIEVNPAISPDLNAIILRAMQKKPEDRFQSAEEFRGALRGISDAQSAAIPQAAVVESVGSAVTLPSQYAAQAPAGGQPLAAWQPPAAGQPVTGALPPAYATGPQDAAPQPPPFTPVAIPAPPRVATAGPRRGLWIGMGVAIALAALVAVGIILPRVFSTHANPKPPAVIADMATPPATTAQPAATPDAASVPTPTAQQPAQASAAAANPAAADSAQAAPASPHSVPAAHAQTGAPPRTRPAYVSPNAPSPAAAAPAATATPAAAPPAGPSPQEMRDAHMRFSNLESRADAALAGVDQIRSQQQAQGFDIRGDILAAMNRLHRQLDMSRQALAQNDLESANDFMKRADADTERLEKFLGR